MPPSRVVITGLGVVSPFGVGRERFWDGVSRGLSGARAVPDLDPDIFACRVAAPVPDEAVAAAMFEGSAGDDESGGRADPKRYSKVSRIAVLAAREALQDAGLDVAGSDIG